MSDVIDALGERLFFRCGHERSHENMAPKGRHHRSGKPAFRCRICLNEKERERFRLDPRRREAAIRRKRLKRLKERRPSMADRIRELEEENTILKRELDATIDALIAARAASADRSPEGEDAQRLHAKHESAVPSASEADAPPPPPESTP